MLATAVPRDAAAQQFAALQSLRTAFGVDYERVGYDTEETRSSGYDQRQTTPIFTIQGAGFLLDPGILSFDGFGDFRFGGLTRSTDVVDIRTSSRLRNLRLGLTILSARGAPLRLFFERVANRVDQRQTGSGSAGARRYSLLGSQSTKGFNWQFAGDRAPQILASGAVMNRHDEGAFASGGEIRNREKRFELRASKFRNRYRYEMSLTHRSVQQTFPAFGLRNKFGNDLVRGRASLKPTPRLTVSLGGHFSRISFGRSNGSEENRDVNGGGADAGFTWDWSDGWSFSGSVTTAASVVELLSQTSGPAPVPQPIPDEVVPVAVRDTVVYKDANARVHYRTRSGSTVFSAGPRVLVLDPPKVSQPTLDELHTIDGQAEHSWRALSFDFGFGGNVSAGRALSNYGNEAPYRELGAHLRIGHGLGPGRLSADGAVTKTTGAWFYPVGGNSWRLGATLDAGAPSWARLRGSVTASRLVRDTYLQYGSDRNVTYSAGLSGPRYDVTFDYVDVRSSATGLVNTALVGVVRPDVLAATRQDLFGLLYGTTQDTWAASARVTVIRGLDLQARVYKDRRIYPGVYQLFQRGGRVGLVWLVGSTQIDFGVERLNLESLYGVSSDRRLYLRILRHLPIF